MDFRILGPLEVLADDEAVPLGGVKPRTLLAVLLLHANEPVSAERLAHALWGEDAPAGAVRTIQVYVSRLRKALGAGEVLETTPAGYRLRVGPGELDLGRFEQQFAEARDVLDAGDPEAAAALLREAIALWRGDPLAELTFESSVQADVARLEEQRLAAVELRIDADLAAGRETELVGELRRLVAEHPTRERLAGQLMLALYRCGRQADALEAYDRTRRVLMDEVGVAPGPELRRLQEAILHHDASLELRPAAAELPRELDPAAAPALEGRGSELAWLRERWETIRTGAGALITISGERGTGKTRLAAELAGEAHAEGAVVLHVAAGGAADDVLDAIERARAAPRPTLLVLDDVDLVGDGMRRELAALAREIAHVPVLVLATGEDVDTMRALGPAASLMLDRLGIEAVRAIGVAHAPAHARDAVPAERLLEESGGVARRVHALASQWARREAAARVSEAAGRTEAGRRDLRFMEATLAEDVAAFEATRERADGGDEAEPASGAVVCPFKGLASFQTADAQYFFGRERLVAELVARAVGAPLLAIVGPSGSGKSSVLRAGLIPALAGGVLPGSERTRQIVMRPGPHPLRELRRALEGVGGGDAVTLAIDQFEETFTLCHDEAERAGFVDELVALGGERGLVLLALRADHYGRCAAYPALSRLLAANHVLVGAMRSDELRRAVECPAQRAGLVVEPELADALVADVEGEPGALPLLSTALLELWQRRDGRRLRHATYERSGGVHGAVARLAEDAYGSLDEEGQTVARRVLLRLADVRDDGTVERRRRSLDDLGSGDDPVERVVELLADRRMLTVSAGTVELAHEALLREWPRLRDWIDADRDILRLERSLRSAAEEWRRLDRDDGALLRGARLMQARQATEGGELTLPRQDQAFVAASLERYRRDRAGRRRRITVAFTALAVGLVAIAVVAGVAIHQGRNAREERDVAVSRELALQSQNEVANDPELAMSLALSALDSAPTRQADAALRQATLAWHQLKVFNADPLTAHTAAYSPDGDRIVTGGDRGIVRLWDAARGRSVALLQPRHGAVLTARYARDGTRIALGFADGTVTVLDASLNNGRDVLHVARSPVESVAFDGNAARVGAALADGTVRVASADGVGPTTVLHGNASPVRGVDISPDGTRVASAGEDGSVREWSLDGGPARLLHHGRLKEAGVRFSPDGKRIVAVGYDGRVRFFDARTGAAERTISGEGRELYTVAFSREGRRFAVAGGDGVIRVWGTPEGPPVAVLRGQGARIFDVGFGVRQDRIVSAGDDGTVRTWDAGTTQAWVDPAVTDAVGLSRDARLAVTSSEDGTVRVWDVATGSLRRSVPGPKGYTAASFSPASDDVVIGSDIGSTISVLPLQGAPRLVARTTGGLFNVSYDRSGRQLVYVDNNGTIAVRDLRSERTVRMVGGPKDITYATLSPDGRQVAAGTKDGKIVLWRIDRPARPQRIVRAHRGFVYTVNYRSDGAMVSAGADRTIRLWPADGGPPVVLRGPDDEIFTAIFTPDGRHVLAASADHKLRLWDARGGDPLVVLQSGDSPLYDVAESPDGTITTVDGNDVVRVFRCAVCGSLASVRTLARSRRPRPLTAADRRRFLAATG